MSESAITLLDERPRCDSAYFVVNPRSLELGWLEDKDLRPANVRLASGIKNTPPAIIQPGEWRVFLEKLAAEYIHSADRIVSVTTNRGMGIRLAILLYSKRPSEIIFIGPDGEYCPSFFRGFLVAMVSGLWRSAGQIFYRVVDALTGGRSQALYAILLEYPRSLVWVRGLINYSFTASPKNPELGRQKKKVIHINNALAPGGSERQFVNTVLGLKRSSNANVIAAFVRLFQFEKSDFYLPLIEGAGIELMTMQRVLAGSDTTSAVPLPRHAMPANIRDQLLYYSMIFRRERPDVVHLWQDETSLLGGLAAVAEGVPRIIMSSRNLAPHRFQYYRHYWKKMYRALAAHPSVMLINNSQAGADDYARWLGILPTEFKVVRNGFLAPLRMNADQEKEKGSRGLELRLQNKSRITVGSVFRFWPEKDPMMWLQIVKIIVSDWRRSNIDFVIAGDGPMRKKMERFITENNLTDCVTLLGVTDSVQDLLLNFDVFLLTSKVEGTPNVIIEAQAAGVPVITTTAGGAEETVNDGVTGWVVRKRSPRAIARKLVDVLDDPDSLLRASAEAPQFVLTRFGMDRMISETMALYDISPSGE